MYLFYRYPENFPKVLWEVQFFTAIDFYNFTQIYRIFIKNMYFGNKKSFRKKANDIKLVAYEKNWRYLLR